MERGLVEEMAMKTRVYKQYGYWWVRWANPNTCFDTDYNGAQRFANKVVALA